MENSTHFKSISSYSCSLFDIYNYCQSKSHLSSYDQKDVKVFLKINQRLYLGKRVLRREFLFADDINDAIKIVENDEAATN